MQRSQSGGKKQLLSITHTNRMTCCSKQVVGLHQLKQWHTPFNDVTCTPRDKASAISQINFAAVSSVAAVSVPDWLL